MTFKESTTVVHLLVIQGDGGHGMVVSGQLHLSRLDPLLLLIKPGENLLPIVFTIMAA